MKSLVALKFDQTIIESDSNVSHIAIELDFGLQQIVASRPGHSSVSEKLAPKNHRLILCFPPTV